MRVAMIAYNPSDPPVNQIVFPDCPHDVRAFNPAPASDAVPCLLSYASIEALYPPDWRPDVYLHLSVEYHPVPQGIEEADCLTVATAGDWNLGWQALEQVGGAFDLLIADQNGCDRLHAAGFPNVRYVPLWGYDPIRHRRLSGGEERDLDIVMVGNFNHEVQRERALWLARVAKLSRRYRVCLTSHVFGEEYTRLMNRARIVFNRSIRGEINMRVYEAARCGGLLFYERENPEIRALFADRRECVLYGEDDLEALLDHYLALENAAERERIAEAAFHKAAPYTEQHVCPNILTLVEREYARFAAGVGRSLRVLPAGERLYRYAYQQITLPRRERIPAAEAALACLKAQEDTGPEVTNALACATAEAALDLSDPAPQRSRLVQAVGLLRECLRRHPEQIIARINLAQISLLLEERQPALMELREAVSRLRAPNLTPAQMAGPCFPRRFDLFQTEWERAHADHPPDSPDRIEALQAVLLWSAQCRLSETGMQLKRASEAVQWATGAITARPDLHTGWWLRGRAQAMVGRLREAEADLRAAYTRMPLLPDLWIDLANLLLTSSQYDKCHTFLLELRAILAGCPYYAFWQPTLDALTAALPTAS